jgi:hypothetical protein
MGSIKNLFSGLFGIIVSILKLPITLITLPLKLLSSGKDKGSSPAPKASKDKGSSPALKAKKKSGEAFYLEMEDAKGFTESAPKAETSKAKAPQSAAPAASTASALNLPQPTVTTAAPEVAYSQFGSRRGPGANMKSFLDMAKTVKSA